MRSSPLHKLIDPKMLQEFILIVLNAFGSLIFRSKQAQKKSNEEGLLEFIVSYLRWPENVNELLLDNEKKFQMNLIFQVQITSLQIINEIV